MVEGAKQHDVVAFTGAAIDPVLDMVSFGSMRRDAAPREAAELIARFKCSAKWRWNRPARPSDIDRQSVALSDRDDLAVASNPAGNFPRERHTGFN